MLQASCKRCAGDQHNQHKLCAITFRALTQLMQLTQLDACSKKYWIEKLEGEKVVGRKKGFTATACTAAVAAASETPQFQFLPTGDKVTLAGDQKCVKGESEQLVDSCATACPGSCQASVASFLAAYEDRTGLVLDQKANSKLVKSCTRRCNQECSKGGTAYDYVVSYRKY